MLLAGLSKQSYLFCTHNFCIDLSSSSTGLCRPALKVVCAKTHVTFEIRFKQYAYSWRFRNISFFLSIASTGLVRTKDFHFPREPFK